VHNPGTMTSAQLVGQPGTTAIGILARSREKGLLDESKALQKLAALAQHGRYKDWIIEDARRRLKAKP
jgi:hypothetical protein